MILFLLENIVTAKKEKNDLFILVIRIYSLFAGTHQQLVLILCFYHVIETQF